jgi:transcriptional regulator with XRE-family HTH domain
MDMRRLVGRKFARLRRAKGLTQEQVAERSGFSRQHLSGLEYRRPNPTIVSVYELASALEVSYLQCLQVPHEAAGTTRLDRPRFWERRRAQNLFCGCCGGQMSNVGKCYLAC